MRSNTVLFPGPRFRHSLASVVLVLLVMGAGVAQAEPDPLDLLGPPVSPVPRTTKRWYGYQIILADLGSFVLVSGGFGKSAQKVGVVTFVAAAPIIHGMHGNIFGAALSPVMRVVLPIAGVYTGQKLFNCAPRDEYCSLVGGLLGGGLGLVIAIGFDGGIAWSDKKSSLFADVDQPDPRKPVTTMAFTSAGLVPMPNRGAAVVLGGNF